MYHIPMPAILSNAPIAKNRQDCSYDYQCSRQQRRVASRKNDCRLSSLSHISTAKFRKEGPATTAQRVEANAGSAFATERLMSDPICMYDSLNSNSERDIRP
jgi:hypothetical protein